MRFQFTDTVALGGSRITRDGYFVSEANIARTGIQLYAGSEVGKPEMPIVRVYRSEDAVFDQRAMGSFAHRPITNDHPKGMVDAKNWKQVAVGALGDHVARDGDHLRVPLVLMDAAAIADVQAGKRELSCGYLCDLDWTPGKTPDGEDFDASQIDITGNHLAIVKAGRAGQTCRIGDSWTLPETADQTTRIKEPAVADVTLRTVTVDGFSVQTTDHGVQAIERLQRQLLDSTALVTERDNSISKLRTDGQAALDGLQGQIDALRSSNQQALDAKDGEIAALKVTHQAALDAKAGEIAALKAQAPTAETLDSLVAERGKVITAARAFLGDAYNPTGKTDEQIRKEAVEKRMGAAAVADKGPEYIRACFDTLTAEHVRSTGRDPIRDAMLTRANIAAAAGGAAFHDGGDLVAVRDSVSQAKAKRNAHLEGAWRGDAATAA